MMKTKVAMAISLAGVLAAGTAAALVNTHVLNGGTHSPLAIAAPPTKQQGTSAQAVSSPADGSTAAVPAAPNPSAAASPTQATYAIGDSGTVTLDTAGDVLKVVSVAPASGWTVPQSESSDANSVEVKFQSDTTEVDFQANLLYGVVRTSVETHDRSATTDTIGATVGGGDDNGGAVSNGLPGGDDGAGGDD